MKKEKIAISVDRTTLDMVNAMVDKTTIRSRSQAIEYLISKGIEHQYIRTAILLIRGSDAKLLLKDIEGTTLLAHHLDWLAAHGVTDAILITGKKAPLEEMAKIAADRPIRLRTIVEEKEAGTVPALLRVRKEMGKNAIVMLADTRNEFDLTKMILFHLKADRVATVGLISSDKPEKYSCVLLEGDRIVAFERHSRASHVIDAGIYIVSPRILKQLSAKQKFLDRDVFPALCRTNEISGYFTHGTYRHYGE